MKNAPDTITAPKAVAARLMSLIDLFEWDEDKDHLEIEGDRSGSFFTVTQHGRPFVVTVEPAAEALVRRPEKVEAES